MKIVIIVLTVLVILFLLLLFLIAPGRGCKETREKFYHLNLAHRGLHTKDKSTPENSMKGFAAAAEAGYGIEMDIQLTKDRQVVVFHDDTLKRVCGVEGRVDDYTYEELQAFSLCGTDQRIPLFTDYLKLIDGRVPLLIELKHNCDDKLLCEKALKIMREYKGVFCIESFSPFIVGWFKKNAPDILRGQLSAPAKDLKSEIPGWQSFMLANLLTNVIARPHFVAYDKEKHSFTVKLCEKMGAMPVVWTVRDTDDHKHFEQVNDAVIFELYRPEIKY